MNEIIEASDGVMVARGDMGVEISFEKLPHVQKDMLKKAKELGKYSITATQMLESMIQNVRPTRAEISDVANAIYDGTAAIMLSGETSVGKYPVLVVETMRKIAEETESTIDYQKGLNNFIPTKDITCGIGSAACSLATNLDASAILVTTLSGNAAQNISRFRPDSKIVALTPNYNVYFKLGMLWGVLPLLDKTYYNTDELLQSAREKAKQFGYVKSGDVVIQTAGLMTRTGGSNILVVSEID